MSRHSRLVLAGVPAHVVQRGNNRQPCFFHDWDYQHYLEWLELHAQQTGCAVHAYVLMTNHVHLLVTATEATGLAALMKALGQRYAQYINRVHQRSGTLWEGRYYSCLTDDEYYVLACHRYIELNPVRAGMVAHPADYRWSSYRAHAQSELSPLLTDHDCYLRLGSDDCSRQRAYRALFDGQIPLGLADEIRHATKGNWVLGNTRFAAEIEAALQRRARPRPAGRPRNA